MAFRGNPNAGAADPQFLNFLFNRQDAKMKQERQLALDRLAAGQQYEEERRKNAEFELNQAIKTSQFEMERSKFLSEQSDKTQAATISTQNELASPEFDERSQVANAQASLAEPESTGQPLAPEESLKFNQIAFENDPNIFAPSQSQRQEVVDKNFGPIERSAKRIAAAQARAFPGTGTPEQIEAETYDAIELQAAMDKFVVKRKLDAANTAEDRTAAKAEAAAIAKENRTETALANRFQRKASSLNRSIEEATRRMDAAKTPGARQAALADRTAFIAERDRREFENNPGEVIAGREKTFNKFAEYRSIVDSVAVLDLIEQRPDILGPRANLSQWFKNVIGLGRDLTGLSRPSVIRFLNSDENTDEEKKFVTKIFIEHVDPRTGKDIERVRLQELRLKWIIENANNPNGRTAIREIENIKDIIGFTDLFTSSDIAIDKIGAMRDQFKEDMRRLQPDLRQRRGETQFDPKTGHIIGEPLRGVEGFDSSPLPAPLNARPRAGGTAGPDVPGVPGVPSLEDMGLN